MGVRTLVTHSATALCAAFLFLPHFDQDATDFTYVARGYDGVASENYNLGQKSSEKF